ncbi:MAG: LamG domain-containing protein [Pirellulaceae bacterium]
MGGPASDPPGDVFTLLVRVCDPQGTWNAPLFGSYGGDSAVSMYLHGVDGATLPQLDRNFVNSEMTTPAAWMFGWPDGPRAIRGSRGVVEFVWGAQGGVSLTPARLNMLPKSAAGEELPPLLRDAHSGVQRLIFPLEPAGPSAWHDIVVRRTDAKLQLWLDGVLVDEEFPLGVTRPATALRLFDAAQLENGQVTSGFKGLLDHAALWQRALTDSEIIALSGGVAEVQQRERAVLGELPARMQYFRARGHNSKAGDCIPFFHDGKFWMFYPTPDYDGNRGGIQLATSEDGEEFTKQEPHPFLPGGDCEVFADPDPQQRRFHLLKAGQTSGSGLPLLQDKTLVCGVSPADLDQRGVGVLTVEGTGGQFDSLVLGEAAARRWMAGSDNFHRTQRDQQQNAEETAKPGEWVQIAAVYADTTVTLYRNGARYAQYVIEKPLHFAPGARVILGLRHLARRGDPAAHFRGLIADARIYDTALTDTQIAELRPHEPAGPQSLVWFDFQTGSGDRAGTLPPAELEGCATLRDGHLVLDGGEACLVSGGGWGGNLVLRELVQHDDGTLGTRFVPEMIPATGQPLPQGTTDNSTRLEATQGRQQILLDNIPNDARLTLTLAPQGSRLAIWVEGGTLLVRDVTIWPLLEHTPPGALRAPER